MLLFSAAQVYVSRRFTEGNLWCRGFEKCFFLGGHSGGDSQDKLEGFFWLSHRDVRCSEL